MISASAFAKYIHLSSWVIIGHNQVKSRLHFDLFQVPFALTFSVRPHPSPTSGQPHDTIHLAN
jgi:hypothetical protein